MEKLSSSSLEAHGDDAPLVPMGEEQRDRYSSQRPDRAHELLFEAPEVTRMCERQGLDSLRGARELLPQLGDGGLLVARFLVSYQAQGGYRGDGGPRVGRVWTRNHHDHPKSVQFQGKRP